MAEKVAELKLADLGRHHAEKQVLDLQQRYLALQAPGPDASSSTTQQVLPLYYAVHSALFEH